MAGSEAIINKIISDAEENANAILSGAEKTASETIEKAKELANAKIVAERESAENDARLVVERKKTVGVLDSRKIALRARQELLDECFEKAEQKILSLPKDEYLDFIGKLIEENADDGDEIVLSPTEKYISKEFVEKLSEKTGKKLGISEERENYVGGVILRSSSCDKNLTLKALLRTLREKSEREVAAALEVL